LRISNASYDRDNGQYECRVKRKMSGEVLHSKSLALTVLLEPSRPVISVSFLFVNDLGRQVHVILSLSTYFQPSSPVVATEGRPLNLTCSSSGGSPPPQIYWYREGQAQLLEAELTRGANRDEPTKSVLTVTPGKEHDGAVYRCTAWNRALGQNQKLETAAKLDVNCEYRGEERRREWLMRCTKHTQ